MCIGSKNNWHCTLFLLKTELWSRKGKSSREVFLVNLSRVAARVTEVEERALGVKETGRCSQHRLHLVLQHGHPVVNEIARGKCTKIVEGNGTALGDKVGRLPRRTTKREATRGRWFRDRTLVPWLSAEIRDCLFLCLSRTEICGPSSSVWPMKWLLRKMEGEWMVCGTSRNPIKIFMYIISRSKLSKLSEGSSDFTANVSLLLQRRLLFDVVVFFKFCFVMKLWQLSTGKKHWCIKYKRFTDESLARLK